MQNTHIRDVYPGTKESGPKKIRLEARVAVIVTLALEFYDCVYSIKRAWTSLDKLGCSVAPKTHPAMAPTEMTRPRGQQHSVPT